MHGSKKSLKPTAVPYRYDEVSDEELSTSAGADQLKLLTPTKTYNKSRGTDTVEVVFPSPSNSSIISTPQKKKDFVFNSNA